MLNCADFVDIAETRRRNKGAILPGFVEEDFLPDTDYEEEEEEGDLEGGSDVDEEGNLVGLINDGPSSEAESFASEEEEPKPHKKRKMRRVIPTKPKRQRR
ncbi:hypothetical protein BJ508DRAFT_334937, partial [Ascobolus immersus RN42]